MTESARSVTQSEEWATRLVRVLDAASELLVRWGYRRVTIDDVAERAGVGKGTVYLHFRSKEALFLTVLLRGYHDLITGIADRIRADPREVLPSRLVRSTYLAMQGDPLTRALYLGDGDMLNRLARESVETLGEMRTAVERQGRRHFELLREAGLLRTDLPVDEQLYLFNAVGGGFFLLEPMDLPGAPGSPAQRADLMAYAVRAVLEDPDAAPPGPELAAVAARQHESLLEHVDREWQRRVRSPGPA
ncbi:TetR/AcrR family transcriptional regulator [Pseudonocardia spinosispora]|uniref:TetR/AcrR family transcriptional regulator n=1 Tax=Pseudonocardia spinosispora TaxID=103441 RepID=UPI00048ED61E|nr:TetR/AcrR family transcriptional regulator [Pseudonocardia spinosispora]